PDQRFVQALYNDLLGRAGFASEVDGWVSRLPSLGRQGVASAIQRSPEALDWLVEKYYRQLFARPRDSTVKAFWVSRLLAGATAEKVIASFLSSAEFTAHANALIGGADASANFIRALYRVVLNRDGEAGGVNFWVGQLTGQGRQGGVSIASPLTVALS